jgi:hypothetical protein
MHLIDSLCSVCVTRHHEFVLYESRCILVRDRGTGDFIEHHALDERVSLVPTVQRSSGTASVATWDLVIHTFGLRVQVGPVIAVVKPDELVRARVAHAQGLTQHLAARCLQRAVA